MNITNTLGLSPSSFRRVLTEHGRTTTPGLLESPMTPKLQKRRAKIEDKPVFKESSVSVLEKVTNEVPPLPAEPEKDIEEIRKVVKSPLSKTPAVESARPDGSFSFYKRPFRVRGKDAWEYAMRDLGSIDTHLNRYGYVEPHQRYEIPLVKRR